MSEIVAETFGGPFEPYPGSGSSGGNGSIPAPGQTFNNATLNSATIAGTVNLVSTSTSKQFDAQVVSAGTGTLPNAGELNYTADFHHFYTYDSTEQFRVGNVPAASEFFQAQGGLTGDGATLIATNGTLNTGNVDANFVAQGTGAFLFGNYNGLGFGITDAGNLTNGTYWTATGGISSAVPPKLASSEDGQIDAATGKSVLLSSGGQVHVKATNLDGGSSLVNFWEISGGSTGGLLHFETAGSDNSVSAFFRCRGLGNFTFANVTAGNLLGLNTSQAGTSVSAPSFRTSSTVDPIRLFSNDSIAIAGPSAGGAMATTATTGFIMIPMGAGAPTGVPTKLTMGVPLYFDTTNTKLWAYANGAWKGVAFT